MKDYIPFEKFIATRRLVRPRLAKYYANHVKTYLDFCNFDRKNLTYHTRRLFLQSLEGKLKDWQIRQTDEAITMYFANYLPQVHNITIEESADVNSIPNGSGMET